MIPTGDTLSAVKQTMEIITQILVMLKWGVAAISAGLGIVMFWLRRIIRKEAQKAVVEATAKVDQTLFSMQKRIVRSAIDQQEKIGDIAKRLDEVGKKVLGSISSEKENSDEHLKKYELAIQSFKEIIRKSEAARQKDLADFQKVIVDRYRNKGED